MNATAKYKETRQQLFEQFDIAPQSGFVRTSGPVEKVHYLELGSGRPLILIHGGLSHSSEWIPILKPLSESFHVYAVDRPGHGLSDPINYRGVDYRQSATGFVRSFLDGLNLERVFLLGNSMGGYFSLCFALDHPERVDSLVLIGAPAGLNRWIPPMLRLLSVRGLNWLLMKTIARPSAAGAKMLHRQLLMVDAESLPETYFEHVYYSNLLPGAATAHRTMLENVLTLGGWREDLYLAGQLEQLSVPTHFIWGAEDAFESPETGQTKAARAPDHTFEIVDRAGHCPWLDRPETCSELILGAIE